MSTIKSLLKSRLWSCRRQRRECRTGQPDLCNGVGTTLTPPSGNLYGLRKHEASCRKEASETPGSKETG